MNKLIATIKYGSAKTKAFLALVFVLLAGGTALGIYGAVNFMLWALATGGAMAVIGLIMILMANFSTESVDVDDEEDDESKGRNRGRQNRGERSRDGQTRTERGRDGQNRSERGRDADSGDDSSSKSGYTVNEYGEVDFGVIDGVLPENREKYRQIEERKKYAETMRRARRNAEKKGRVFEEAPDDIAADDSLIQVISQEEKVSRYTPEVFRKVLHKYKIKKNYVPIIIDECASFGTDKTPALVWNKRDKVYFLLMEGNERVVDIPMKQFTNVTYRQNVQEKDIPDYDAIRRKMGVYEEFEDVMPSFNTRADRMGRTTYFKNQYILGRDIAITARSLKSLMTKYKFSLNIFESLNLSGEFSSYFKIAYETRILWTDNVIGQQEYQSRIRNILENMADDDSLRRLDFMDELEKMVQYRLITDEYADYYHGVRQRRDANARRR